MEDTLKELCREARDRQNITIQDLADETGISISTIGNFFASKSKAPNVYNAGAICAALGVSLDRYFGITEKLSPEDSDSTAAAQPPKRTGDRPPEGLHGADGKNH